MNKRRVEKLITEGRLCQPGSAVIERGRIDGSWTALDMVETLAAPPDLAEALRAHPPAEAIFTAFPCWSRRGILKWIAHAEQPETRVARILDTGKKTAAPTVLDARKPTDPRHRDREEQRCSE